MSTATDHDAPLVPVTIVALDNTWARGATPEAAHKELRRRIGRYSARKFAEHGQTVTVNAACVEDVWVDQLGRIWTRPEPAVTVEAD